MPANRAHGALLQACGAIGPIGLPVLPGIGYSKCRPVALT